MKLISKPEGFDLRDKRSDKSNKGADWTVQDALFDASKTIAEAKAHCSGALVLWREVDAQGNGSTHYRYAGDFEMNAPALIVSGMGSVMGWDRR
jgi:hypothetical protein